MIHSKNRLRYSRERASQSLEVLQFVFFNSLLNQQTILPGCVYVGADLPCSRLDTGLRRSLFESGSAYFSEIQKSIFVPFPLRSFSWLLYNSPLPHDELCIAQSANLAIDGVLRGRVELVLERLVHRGADLHVADVDLQVFIVEDGVTFDASFFVP